MVGGIDVLVDGIGGGGLVVGGGACGVAGGEGE